MERGTELSVNPLSHVSRTSHCSTVSRTRSSNVVSHQHRRSTNNPSVSLPHELVRRFLVSGPWIVLQLSAVTMDILSSGCSVLQYFRIGNCITVDHRTQLLWCMFAMYAVDLLLRIFAFRSIFFRKTLNIADLSVTTLGFALNVVRTVSPTYVKLEVVRLLRAFRVILMLSYYWRRICVAMRYVTGRHKARFVDDINDIDLDLVYVTPRLIAMSVPTNGWLSSLYRNPMSEVVDFFETYHAGHYMIVNLCPEWPYPAERFKSGKLLYYNVQDHMPPSASLIFDFLQKSQEWYDSSDKNVIAIHCKGGKGRTGTFCTIWLLYDFCNQAMFADELLNPSVDTCMETFALQRTDINVRTGDVDLTVQGVETPSQVRFCRNMETYMKLNDMFWPKLPTPPGNAPVHLMKLEALHFFKEQPLDPLIAVVSQYKRNSFISGSGQDSWSLGNVLVDGDVRVTVAKPGKDREWWDADKVAGKEPGCLFYFVLHTAFLDGNELHLSLSEVDKACKKRNKYNEYGSLKLTFSRDVQG